MIVREKGEVCREVFRFATKTMLLRKENKRNEEGMMGKKKGKGKEGSLSGSLYICNKNNVTGERKQNE